MTTVGQGFSIWAGDDVELDATIRDENGAPLDLTGAVLRWGLATMTTPSVPVVQKTSTSGGIVITDATGGLATVILASADTETLKGRYVHQLQVTDGTGKTSTVSVGMVVINTTMF